MAFLKRSPSLVGIVFLQMGFLFLQIASIVDAKRFLLQRRHKVSLAVEPNFATLPDDWIEFKENEYYHFFPIGEGPTFDKVYEVPKDWCNDKCKNDNGKGNDVTKGPGSGCKPLFRDDRTLVWQRRKDGKTYVAKKGGWFFGSSKELVRDTLSPQLLRNLHVKKDSKHPKSIVIEGKKTEKGFPNPKDFANGSTNYDNVAEKICKRGKLSKGWNRQFCEINPSTGQEECNMTYKGDKEMHLVKHWVLWTDRDISGEEELSEFMYMMWPEIKEGTGHKKPILCKQSVTENYEDYLNGIDCNVVILDGPFKSWPSTPHVQVYVTVKGEEKTKIPWTHCSIAETIRGRNHKEAKQRHNEVFMFDAQGWCMGKDGSNQREIFHEFLYANMRADCRLELAKDNNVQARCVKEYVKKSRRGSGNSNYLSVEMDRLSPDFGFTKNPGSDYQTKRSFFPFYLCDPDKCGSWQVANKNKQTRFDTSEEYFSFVSKRAKDAGYTGPSYDELKAMHGDTHESDEPKAKELAEEKALPKPDSTPTKTTASDLGNGGLESEGGYRPAPNPSPPKPVPVKLNRKGGKDKSNGEEKKSASC